MEDNLKWAEIKGQEGRYSVSNIGTVKSHINNIILKPHINKLGYSRVKLSFGSRNNYKIVQVHRLVALSFIPNPENKPQVNHINGDKTDNRSINLEWNTSKENNNHALRTGLRVNPKGSENGMAKVTEEDVLEIRRLAKENNHTQREIANMFNTQFPNIHRIIHRKRWKHI